jgi:hexosaminidase
MNANGIASIDDLYVYFHDRLEALLADHPRLTAVYWQEAWEELMDLPTDAVVQFWSSKGQMRTAAALGHPVLLSAGWYLDQQVPSLNRATHYEWLDTWLDMYNNEPAEGFPQDNSVLNLYGGEVTMWSEQVDDLSIHARVWPRAAAVAERLWSRIFEDSDAVRKTRFDTFSCNLKRWYGISSSPLQQGAPCVGAY